MTTDTDDLSSIFGVVYSLLSAAVIIGHQVSLYFIQRRVLFDLGGDPEVAAVDAVLTWLPLVVWCVAVVLGIGVAVACYEDSWMVIRSLNSFAIIAIMFTYTAQIMYYIVRDVILYLDQLTPEETLCYCVPFTALSAQVGSDVYNCTCLVPFESCDFTLVTSANVTAGLDSNILRDSGIAWDGDVETRQGEVVRSGENVRSVRYFTSLNEMIIVLALSLIVSVLRFPLWSALKFLVLLVREKQKPRDKPRSKDATYFFRFGFPWRWIRDNWIEGDAVEVCYVGFVEGIDSFSLVAAILNHGDMFAADSSLTVAALFLACFNLVVVHLSGVLVAITPPKYYIRSQDARSAHADPETHRQGFYAAALATLPYFNHRRREKREKRRRRSRARSRREPDVYFHEDPVPIGGKEKAHDNPVPVVVEDPETECCDHCCSVRHFSLVVKFLMIISCNLPFFIFRMYLYYAFRGFETKKEPIFLLLTIKEAVILLMGLLRFGLGNKTAFAECCKGKNKISESEA